MLLIITTFCKFTPIVKYFHKFRYLLSLLIFIFLVSLNINGSSIGVWNDIVNDNPDIHDTVLLGQSREIRSDEWKAFTPMALSQKYNNYGYFSDIDRATQTDMFMIYGQPVYDISMVFRPFQLGYLFLDSAGGLSFYWCGRLFALFLATYEFMLLISKKRKLMSLLGAILIAFSPQIQWWFSTNGYIEMIISVEVSIILFDKYMLSNNIFKRVIYTSGIMICAGCFILTLYPPVMILLAYVLLGLIIWVILNNRHNFNINIKTGIATLCTMTFFALLIARPLIMSSDTILTIINTAYPGKREYLGGGLTLSTLFDYPRNIIAPITNHMSNNFCEEARFIDFAPLSYILALFLLIKKKQSAKPDFLVLYMLSINILFIIFTSLQMPDIFYKLTLLNKTSVNRITFVIGLTNIIILVRSVYLIDKYNVKFSIKDYVVICIVCIIITSTSLLYSYNNITNKMFGYIFLLVLVTLICIITITLIINNHSCPKLLLVFLMLVLFTSGFLVNPIRTGIQSVYSHGLSKTIHDIVNKDPDSVWIAEGETIGGDYLLLNGAKTINCVNTYPTLERWHSIDITHENEKIYNRYAHIQINLINDNNQHIPKFRLIQGDIFEVYLNTNELKKLNVNYIVSRRDLFNNTTDTNSIKTIYESNVYKIYKLT
ncbi:MAG: hypothetical protein Q4E88_06195 [Coriobacteriia bacterium]|nr:hypothetical protein [Coriobacteriia bacterium]